jgi:adenosylmethionine-8-amino-7-oxononanoate aminotransferase
LVSMPETQKKKLHLVLTAHHLSCIQQKICFTNGFHGRTFGALSVTNQPKYQLPFAPLLPGIKPGNLNDISALTELITPNTCGVIVEPIQVSSSNSRLLDWFATSELQIAYPFVYARVFFS